MLQIPMTFLFYDWQKEELARRKANLMKKDNFGDLHPSYKRTDLGKGVLCKFYDSHQRGSNIVLLDPGVAEKEFAPLWYD